jgi:hypothetical protein
VSVLKLVGFRYSAGRDAYVLRLLGNRFGPVFQVRSLPVDPSPSHDHELIHS